MTFVLPQQRVLLRNASSKYAPVQLPVKAAICAQKKHARCFQLPATVAAAVLEVWALARPPYCLPPGHQLMLYHRHA